MKEKGEGCGGRGGSGSGGRGLYVRVDQIDLKSLDDHLQRHLSRAWSTEKTNTNNKDEEEEDSSGGQGRCDGVSVVVAVRQEWEIDPSKLIIMGAIARGTFGTVHRVKPLDCGEEGHRSESEIALLRTAFIQEVAVWHKLPRLNYLHSKKIVHRDVKTENMLLDKTRTVKIADFGVARMEASNPHDMTGETGTLGYMAPEVLNGNPYNRKCDVYSFGICLWELYCCDMPYPDLSFSEVTSAVARQNLRPEIPRCCPSSLANVMRRCWDANPDKRPEMDEVVSMLEAINTSKGGEMIPVDQQNSCFCLRRYRGPLRLLNSRVDPYYANYKTAVVGSRSRLALAALQILHPAANADIAKKPA